MKTYTRKRTLPELIAHCRAQDWPIDTTKHEEEGMDGVSVHFKVGADSGVAIISMVTGKVIGKCNGKFFSSDNADLDGQPWFDALLDAALTNDPPATAICPHTQAAVGAMLKSKADYEKTYDDFWKPLVEKDGALDLDAVKRELHDYCTFMRNAAEVYCHVTGNRISKVNTDPAAVIGEADARTQEAVDAAVRETGKESVA